MNAFDYFFEHTNNLDKPFLDGREGITHKDLYNSCISLSGWIKEKAGTHQHIFLLSANNLFFLKAYLAIIKSGNICIPLDPSIEKDNFRYINDLSAQIDTSDSGCGKKGWTLFRRQSMFCRNLKPLKITPVAEGGPEKEFDKERCAEIIFTSGSTGKPKGVMISHKNLIANTSSIVEYLQLTPNDRMLVVLPFYYCYGLSLLHTHLRAGGSIVFNNSFIFLGGVLKSLARS